MEIIPKYALGPIFQAPWGRENTFLSKTNLFKTNHAKPLRQPRVILVYRVYLKHRNSILKFRKVRKKTVSIWEKNTMSLFVDVALRAASILENNDFPFCECCPAGGLDFEKSCFFVFIQFSSSCKTRLFA